MTTYTPETLFTTAPSFLAKNTIFLTKAGSHAYGTSTPKSDLDIRGVAVAPMEHYIGLHSPFQQYEASSPIDLVVYDIRKFAKLAMDCNPNIIEYLFMDESVILYTTPEWEAIRSIRNEFLSSKAKATFLGYATQQLKDIRFYSEKMREEGIRNRISVSRAQDEMEHGYDPKNAMHLVRLLRMGQEILEKGEVKVLRPDAAELLEIRNGKMSYKELMEYAEFLEKKVKEAHLNTPLPLTANLDKIEPVIMDIIRTKLAI